MSFRTVRGEDGFTFIHDNEMEQVGYPILCDLPAVQKAATRLAYHIAKIRRTNGFKAINLCVMGCSGTTLGAFVGVELTALGEDKVGFYHVKKPNETHHRCEVADTVGTRHPDPLNVFVDDFVSSGNTLTRTARSLADQGVFLHAVAVTAFPHVPPTDELKHVRWAIGGP